MKKSRDHQNKEIVKIKIPREKTPLFFWRANEFEKKEKNPKLLLITYLIIFGLVVFALFTDNIFMAIIFILFAVIFYFFSNKKPETYTFGITSDGVFAQDHIYEFSSLENFWIFFIPLPQEIIIGSFISPVWNLPSLICISFTLPCGFANNIVRMSGVE